MTDPLKVSEAAVEAMARQSWAAVEDDHGLWEDVDGRTREGVLARVRSMLSAALPVLVAEGWVPPEQLEQVGWCFTVQDWKNPDAWFHFTSSREQQHDSDVPVFRVVRD